MNKKSFIVLTITIIIFIVLFFVSLMVGRYNIGILDFFKALFSKDINYQVQKNIIINLRLPRTIIATLTGISLGISGLLYQEVFQNKLVSPDLLGVSNGAGVGAALAIVLGLSSIFISLFSFTIGIITVLLTVTVSKLFKSSSQTMLILSGIIVSGLMGASLSMIKNFSNPETTLNDITFWLMGSFASVSFTSVYIMLPITVICVAVSIIIRWRINIVALGEETAKTKGINYSFYKRLIIIIATLLTATSVSFCGTIAWIGLIIPHIVRLMVGFDNKNTIPVTIAFGSSFMILIDMLSRSFTDGEIPLSAITGFLGTIIFIIILATKRNVNNEYQN